MFPSGSRARAGYTLLELIVVLLVLAIGAGLAFPRLDEMIFRVRARSALDRLAGDLYYARALAVREGRRTVVRFTRRPNDFRCHAPEYVVVVRGDPERVAKRTELDVGRGGICLQFGTADSLVFNSRGLPAAVNNRKVFVQRGTSSDSMTISLLGRIYRWY